MMAIRVLLYALLAGTVAGCGLKGPLELPERSTNIVIRGPGQAPAAGTDSTTAAPPAATPAPTQPGQEPKPEPPKDDRLPPPPLPGGNPGSSRGG